MRQEVINALIKIAKDKKEDLPNPYVAGSVISAAPGALTGGIISTIYGGNNLVKDNVTAAAKPFENILGPLEFNDNSTTVDKTDFSKKQVKKMMHRAGYHYKGEKTDSIAIKHPITGKNALFVDDIKQNEFVNTKNNKKIYVNTSGDDILGQRSGYSFVGNFGKSNNSSAHVFMPSSNKRLKNMGIFAHELGHAISMNKNSIVQHPLARVAGELGTAYGNFGIGINEGIRGYRASKVKSRDELDRINTTADNISKGVALAGTLSYLPTVAGELEASYRGAKLMPRGIKNKLKPFTGVPSYLVKATTPMLSYGLGQEYKKRINREFEERQ